IYRTTRTRSEVLEKPHLGRTDGDDTVDRRVVGRKIGQREEQRKWSLVGGRGGPAEQLVDSASLSVHVDANVSSSLSPFPLLFDANVSKITFVVSNLRNQRVMVSRTVDAPAEHNVNRASVRKMLSKHDAARNNTTLRRHFVYVITKYLEGEHNSRLEMLLW
ncbi:E3 ubiquitin-protein ligase HERC2, partial [Vespula squamosa]